jgi:arsenate reductase
MTQIKFYGYKRCSTSRKAEKYLESQGISFEFIDITENAPSIEELRFILQIGEYPLKKLFNTSGVVYKSENYKDKIKTMSEEECLKALSQNGKLCKRPMILDEQQASVGWNQEEFEKSWLKS